MRNRARSVAHAFGFAAGGGDAPAAAGAAGGDDGTSATPPSPDGEAGAARAEGGGLWGGAAARQRTAADARAFFEGGSAEDAEAAWLEQREQLTIDFKRKHRVARKHLAARTGGENRPDRTSVLR